MKSLDTGRRAKGCTLGRMAQRGVTVSQLRTFSLKLAATCPWSRRTCPWWADWFPEGPLPYEQLQPAMILEYVSHLGKPGRRSLMEMVSDGPQIPQHFVEFAWKERWSDIMNAVEWYIEANRLVDSACVYVDLLSCNFHTTDRPSRAAEAREVLCECTKLLRVLSPDEEKMKRAWPLRNMEIAAREGKDLYLGCKTAVMACSKPFPGGGWLLGTFDPDIARKFSGVDARTAECKHPQDWGLIEAAFGWKSRERGVDDGWCRFNRRKTTWCAGPILLDAAARDDAGTIVQMGVSDGVRMNSANLRGGIGQTALHVAAGRSATSALRALLDAAMDPNSVDFAGETPLHSAALCGHGEAVRILLGARADPRAESACAELPIEVAQQNPAGFLGVDSADVLAALEDAWAQAGGGGGGAHAKRLRAEVAQGSAAAAVKL